MKPFKVLRPLKEKLPLMSRKTRFERDHREDQSYHLQFYSANPEMMGFSRHLRSQLEDEHNQFQKASASGVFEQMQNKIGSRYPGQIVPLIDYLVKGNQLPLISGLSIIRKLAAVKDAIQHRVGTTIYNGSSSNGEVIVKCNGTGNVRHIYLTKRIANLPKHVQQKYILSAIGDAMNKGRIEMYKENMQASSEAFNDLHKALEGYHKNELLDSTRGSAASVTGHGPLIHATRNYVRARFEMYDEIMGYEYDHEEWLDNPYNYEEDEDQIADSNPDSLFELPLPPDEEEEELELIQKQFNRYEKQDDHDDDDDIAEDGEGLDDFDLEGDAIPEEMISDSSQAEGGSQGGLLPDFLSSGDYDLDDEEDDMHEVGQGEEEEEEIEELDDEEEVEIEDDSEGEGAEQYEDDYQYEEVSNESVYQNQGFIDPLDHESVMNLLTFAETGKREPELTELSIIQEDFRRFTNLHDGIAKMIADHCHPDNMPEGEEIMTNKELKDIISKMSDWNNLTKISNQQISSLSYKEDIFESAPSWLNIPKFPMEREAERLKFYYQFKKYSGFYDRLEKRNTPMIEDSMPEVDEEWENYGRNREPSWYNTNDNLFLYEKVGDPFRQHLQSIFQFSGDECDDEDQDDEDQDDEDHEQSSSENLYKDHDEEVFDNDKNISEQDDYHEMVGEDIEKSN